ncbi:protein of unknown function [Chitinophaga costaii]|uniref:DUF1543 domain-containing protein n=2 Tax=Chitinophaga costaii TaxID=1335309 RepID=A0A1C4CBV3_9BACT|nr:protein of unknown function [Chitinophaga costaii]
MVLLGCKPAGRHIEQHDIFFGIAPDMKALTPHFLDFWPNAGKLHVDGYRPVTVVEGHRIRVVPKQPTHPEAPKLFFLNLGGYKAGELEEYHYKMLSVNTHPSDAINRAKATTFYKHTGGLTLSPHIDDQYGVDVDDIFNVEDILPPAFREHYSLEITAEPGLRDVDELKLGYIKLNML